VFEGERLVLSLRLSFYLFVDLFVCLHVFLYFDWFAYVCVTLSLSRTHPRGLALSLILSVAIAHSLVLSLSHILFHGSPIHTRARTHISQRNGDSTCAPRLASRSRGGAFVKLPPVPRNNMGTDVDGRKSASLLCALASAVRSRRISWCVHTEEESFLEPDEPARCSTGAGCSGRRAEPAVRSMRLVSSGASICEPSRRATRLSGMREMTRIPSTARDGRELVCFCWCLLWAVEELKFFFVEKVEVLPLPSGCGWAYLRQS